MNIQVDPTSSNLASAMLNSKIRLWDTAFKFFIPVLRITSPDHLEYIYTTYAAMIKVLHHKALFRLLITGVKKGRLHCWTSRLLRSSRVSWFQGPKRRVYHRSTGAKGRPWISWRKRRYSKNHCKKLRGTLMKVHRPHEWSNEKVC